MQISQGTSQDEIVITVKWGFFFAGSYFSRFVAFPLFAVYYFYGQKGYSKHENSFKSWYTLKKDSFRSKNSDEQS